MIKKKNLQEQKNKRLSIRAMSKSTVNELNNEELRKLKHNNEPCSEDNEIVELVRIKDKMKLDKQKKKYEQTRNHMSNYTISDRIAFRRKLIKYWFSRNSSRKNSDNVLDDDVDQLEESIKIRQR